MRELLTIIAFCTVLTSAAQNERPWEVLFSQFNTIDDIETQELEDTYEMLCDLEQQPLNINTADRDDLLKLPFLNEKQVEDIHAYIYQYGAMKTVGELAMIESIDFTTRCLLSYFIYFIWQK